MMDLNRKKRFVIDLIILLVVDIVWVASSELTKYVFNDTGFNKPFFSTYLQTSLFSLYLLGFIFKKSWQIQCIRQETDLYEAVQASPDEDCVSQETSSLGESSYEPIKYGEQEKCVDSDDSSCRSVRFSKMAEVRHMSEAEATEAMFSRLSFGASVRVSEIFEAAPQDKFSVKVVMEISLIFCFLWFLANYGYQKALSVSEVGIVNVISSTSSLFTLCLAAVFPSSSTDKFTLSKLVAVVVMVIGIGIISLANTEVEKSVVPLGVLWSLLGAVLYAVYMVFIRKKVPDEAKMDFSMFFGFVGLFNAIILWPGFFILNILGWETFQMPSQKQILYIVVNGLIGTVLSEFMWLWGCFLTSSLMATLSISLTIPLSMLFDNVLKGVAYTWHFYAGVVPVLFSFVAVTVLTHYEQYDPLLDGIRAVSEFCCPTKTSYRLIADSMEEEELIGNEDCDDGNETISNEAGSSSGDLSSNDIQIL